MTAHADLHLYKMLESGNSSAEAFYLCPPETKGTTGDLTAEDPMLLLLGSQITLLGCRRPDFYFILFFHAWWHLQIFKKAL